MRWRPRYSEEQVREAVENSRSVAGALRWLGLRAAGNNHLTLKKLIAHSGIPTEHFDPKWALRQRPREHATPLADVLVEDSTFNRGHLKRRLYDEGLKSRVCELCGQGEVWRGRSMSLILDHINGIATDNRIVCPNCAGTLETHCGRNKRFDRRPRQCLHCGGEFMPKYHSHRYCSQRCGVHSKGSREPKPDTRKVPRPSYEQLLSDLQSVSLVAVGRKYGVSDNAVRKWLRSYEHQRNVGSEHNVGSERNIGSGETPVAGEEEDLAA
jgi:hypothetical protein